MNIHWTSSHVILADPTFCCAATAVPDVLQILQAIVESWTPECRGDSCKPAVTNVEAAKAPAYVNYGSDGGAQEADGALSGSLHLESWLDGLAIQGWAVQLMCRHSAESPPLIWQSAACLALLLQASRASCGC